MAVQGEMKDDVLKRLNRIEGQIRGIHRLIEQEVYCVEVMQQIASVHQALRGVEKMLMKNHLQRCVTEALRSGEEAEAERAYGEIMDVIYKYSR
jgi:DNA-binding FrmR family transcriptional regulator